MNWYMAAKPLLASAITASLIAAPALSQQSELFKLRPGDGAANEQFGAAVAVSDTMALVGAPYDRNTANYATGAAYLFNTRTGQQVRKLRPADVATYDYFGNAVAVCGTTAIVGAVFDDDSAFNSGSAYLINTQTGQVLHKLRAGDASTWDEFGYSVAISDSTALVATNPDDNSKSSAVYVFDTQTGQQRFKLQPNDGSELLGFGSVVAISGSVAIIGAVLDDDNGYGSGSAYLYDTNTGQLLFKLLAADGSMNDRFGQSVAITGNLALVGASSDADNGTSAGSAYVFDTATGQQLFKLLPGDGSAYDLFGTSVAISGTIAVVGASEDDNENGYDAGAAYVFNAGTGQEVQKLLPSDGAAYDTFGRVAVDGEAVVVGAPRDADNGTYSGSAYVFREEACVLVRTPSAPYQSVYEVGDVATIELRNQALPQAINIYFEPREDCWCSGIPPTNTRLVPRSGTGHVFDVNNNSAYFLIDQNTSPGYYDLEVQCVGGSLMTIDAKLNYIGFVGYTPEATLRNALTGNVIRGAGVSLWQWNGTGYNLFRATVAGDGTYAFGNLPDGTYKVLIQYELNGEQWRGPFEVGAGKRGGIPYEDVYLTPVTDDSDDPAIEHVGDAALRVIDGNVGLAVVEPVLSELDNLSVLVEHFTAGEDTVSVSYSLIENAYAGSGRLLCMDQLGNRIEQVITLQAVSDAGPSIIIPAGIGYLENHPNPFNPSTMIAYDLAESGAVVLDIYDAHGRLIRHLVQEGIQAGGRHEVSWDGRADDGVAVSSGVYFCRLAAGQHVETIKLALLK